MPKRNPARSVLGEENLARRVQVEREARSWSYEGLAERMTQAGCPMQGSAVFKIEKSTPRRRITVDELVGFSLVFQLSLEDLATDPTIASIESVLPLVKQWQDQQYLLGEVTSRQRELSEQIREQAQRSSEVLAAVERYLGEAMYRPGITHPAELLGKNLARHVMGIDREWHDDADDVED